MGDLAMAHDYVRLQILIIWVLASVLLSALDVLFFLLIFLSDLALPVTISVPISITVTMITIFASTTHLRQSMELHHRRQYRSKPQVIFLITLAASVLIYYWNYFNPQASSDVVRQGITILSYATFPIAVGFMSGYVTVRDGH